MRVGQKDKLTYLSLGQKRLASPGPSTINAPNQPICSARYALSAEPALPSSCPPATPRPCSSISTKSQRKSPPAHTPFSFSIKLDGKTPKTSRLQKTYRSCRCRRVPPSSIPKTTSGRVHACELAVEPHLQILRRHRRPLLLRRTPSSISRGKSCQLPARDWAVAGHSL